MIITFCCQVLTVLSYPLQRMVRLKDTAEKQAALSVCHVKKDTKSIQTVHRLGAAKQTSSGLGLIQYVNVRANIFFFLSVYTNCSRNDRLFLQWPKFPSVISTLLQWNYHFKLKLTRIQNLRRLHRRRYSKAQNWPRTLKRCHNRSRTPRNYWLSRKLNG